MGVFLDIAQGDAIRLANRLIATGLFGGGGGGGVAGPVSSTDKALARFSGTNGGTIQDGHLTETDAGALGNADQGAVGVAAGGTFALGASFALQTTVAAAGTDFISIAVVDAVISYFQVYALGIDTVNNAVYFKETKITVVRYAGAPAGAIVTALGSPLFEEFDAAVTGVATGWDTTFVAYSLSSNHFVVTVKADPAHITKWTIAVRMSTIPFTP